MAMNNGYVSWVDTTQSLYSPFTPGSVIFQGSGTNLAQNNTKLFWDNSNFRLGIGTSSPSQAIDVTGTGSVRLGSLIGASSTPTVTYGAANGSGGGTVALTGSQIGGYIQFNTGTGTTAGTVLTLTFPNAAPNYIIGVYQPANAVAATAYTLISSSSTTTTISLNVSAPLAASTAYAFNFITISI